MLLISMLFCLLVIIELVRPFLRKPCDGVYQRVGWFHIGENIVFCDTIRIVVVSSESHGE